MKKWDNGPGKGREDERSFARSTREQILYLFILVMFIIISIIVGGQSSTVTHGYGVMANEDWVDENGESVALDDLEPGPHLLSKNLDEIPAGGKAICFTSIDTEFTLYADDEPIYDYHPSVPPRFGRSYGMYVHTVAIPDGAGKISIQVEPVFTSGSADFDRIMIADSGWYMLEHFKGNMFSFGMSTATLMLGAFFLVIGLTNAIMLFRSRHRL